MLRACFVLVGLLASLPAVAGEMTVAEARHFIVGKMFHYTCFEGTRGQGRVYPDGSVAGSIQVRGAGQMRYAVLPPGTIRVNGEAVCASVRGVPIHPCFNLEQLDQRELPRLDFGARLCLLQLHAPARTRPDFCAGRPSVTRPR